MNQNTVVIDNLLEFHDCCDETLDLYEELHDLRLEMYSDHNFLPLGRAEIGSWSN